jgi:hypothetical protein
MVFFQKETVARCSAFDTVQTAPKQAAEKLICGSESGHWG